MPAIMPAPVAGWLLTPDPDDPAVAGFVIGRDSPVLPVGTRLKVGLAEDRT